MARDRNDILKWGDIFDAMMEYHASVKSRIPITKKGVEIIKSEIEGCLYALEDIPSCTLSNPYWSRVEAIANRQREKGIATYGQGIELNPAEATKRLTHLEEELVDALMYCEWIKDKLKELEEKE